MNSKFIGAGEYLCGLRENLELSQADVAKELNVHTQFVSNWERGLCMPPKHCLQLLAKILKIKKQDKENIFNRMLDEASLKIRKEFKGIV